MKYFAKPLEGLIEQFAKLPGIGPKTAQRLAFHVLSGSLDAAQDFASAILNAKNNIFACQLCQNLTDKQTCDICSDKSRDISMICVVSDPRDVIAFEKTGEYVGLYHVLHGNLSPLNNIGPEDIKIKELLYRLSDGNIHEIIISTNPDTDGEATAMYIARLLRPFKIKVTRLAYGIPVGGTLEYIDEVTLMRAFDGRRDI